MCPTQSTFNFSLRFVFDLLWLFSSSHLRASETVVHPLISVSFSSIIAHFRCNCYFFLKIFLLFQPLFRVRRFTVSESVIGWKSGSSVSGGLNRFGDPGIVAFCLFVRKCVSFLLQDLGLFALTSQRLWEKKIRKQNELKLSHYLKLALKSAFTQVKCENFCKSWSV